MSLTMVAVDDATHRHTHRQTDNSDVLSLKPSRHADATQTLYSISLLISSTTHSLLPSSPLPFIIIVSA